MVHKAVMHSDREMRSSAESLVRADLTVIFTPELLSSKFIFGLTDSFIYNMNE